MVEELRVDFSSVEGGGGWYTGVSLARLLSSTCSDINPPEEPREGGEGEEEEESERTEEFYEMLLPTATDSLLILANNIHESDDSRSIYLDQFEAVTDALIRLCSAHNDCIKRAIESSYLLHLLVSDSIAYSHSVMRFLQEIIKLDGEIVNSISIHALESILDELVFKVGGPHKETAVMGLRLLAVFSSYSSLVVELVSEKYRGFSLLLEKWSRSSMDASMLKFVSTLLERVKSSDEESNLHKAAVLIQSGWRGYATRKQLKRMRRGFVQLQRLYRRRKSNREGMKLKTGLASSRSKEIRKTSSMRAEREQQLALLESMPASSIGKYLTNQMNSAAAKIQRWWRGKRKREQEPSQLEREKSAIVIQKAYRSFIKRKISQVTSNSEQMVAPKKNPDKTSLASMLDWFYTSRAESREADRKRAMLISEVFQ